MLIELRLRNFRCFADHRVPLRPTTYVVGRNNAGKSTIIGGLTLISLVANRWGRLPTRDVPDWLREEPVGHRGVSPSLEGMSLDFDSIIHHYGPGPAVLEGRFTSGDSIHVYVGARGKIWAIALDAGGHLIPTRGQGATQRMPSLAVLPQVTPLTPTERILDRDYVRRSATTTLASQHFRNQLFYDLVERGWRGELVESGEFFEVFREMVSETWPGIAIQELLYEHGRIGEPLQLMVREGDFVTEVGHMGHGLQMWLQAIWFLARSRDADTIILDEPDAYTHADVQHRLVRLLARRPNVQKIVSTHSVEILSEVDPQDVLIVDRSQPRSVFAGTLPQVQAVVERLGGVHSLQLARLWTARRLLLLEGDDIDLLRVFHQILFPRAAEGLDTLPRVSIEGWAGFNYAVGGGMLLRNAGGEQIVPYCILDSDYHTLKEIEARYRTAHQRSIELHIWKRKEIESYLLVPAAIRRTLAARAGERTPSEDTIAAQLDVLAEAQKEEVLENVTNEQFFQDRREDQHAKLPHSMRAAQLRLREAWRTQEGRWSICKPKILLGELSQWAQGVCGGNLNALGIARNLLPGELDPEVRGVITAIERGERFPPHV